MKKLFTFLILMIGHIALFAQSQCFISIKPSFDSECILTDYDGKTPELIQLDGDCNFVCKNSEVTYEAIGINGTYTWYVLGGTYTGQGTNTITVQWDNDVSGTGKYGT